MSDDYDDYEDDEVFDDLDDFDDGEVGQPKQRDWVADLLAIKKEPNPLEKKRLVQGYEMNHGPLDSLTKRELGVPGY